MKVNKLINKTIIEITFLVVLCITSFLVFTTSSKASYYDNVTYTDIDVIKNQSMISINDFSSDSQIKLKVSNNSNTKENYKVLLTSNCDLTYVEDYLKVKIDDQEHLLKDLKIKDNYFLIDEGNMKANSKEIELYFAVDDINKDHITYQIPFYFVNDLNI